MKSISPILALLFTASAALAEGVTRPASFEHEEAKKRLVERIVFPDVKGDATAMILCFSQVKSSGKMTETGCYSRDNFQAAFAAAIMKAAKKSSMTPAFIDGRKKKVYVQFRVEFIAKDDQRRIFVYANPGHKENVDAYGYDHVAAQRVIGKEEWMKVCPRRAGFLVMARAFVDEQGRAGSVSLQHLDGIVPTADCQNAIKDNILSSAYTPAMADGVPVPSGFIESFGN